MKVEPVLVEVTLVHIEERIVEVPKQSFKGLTGSWTKYGGKRNGIGYNQHGLATVNEEWVCQSCGRNQPHDLSPYLYEYPVEEYIRVCATCLREDCEVLKHRLNADSELRIL